MNHPSPVIFVNTIAYPCTLYSTFNKAKGFQFLKMLGYCGLCKAYFLNQITTHTGFGFY